jgi:hypothetical protein
MGADIVIRFSEGWTWGWTALEAIATVILVIGIGVALWQVFITRESTRKNTTAQLAIDILREFRNEESKNTLRFIYQLNVEDINNLCAPDLYGIESILDKFQLLGTLVNQKIIYGELSIGLGPPAFRCWYKLFRYIREQREKRGFLYEQYEGYTEYCLNYFNNLGFKVLFQREGGTDNVNLVTELQKKEIRPRSFKEIEKDAKKTINRGV